MATSKKPSRNKPGKKITKVDKKTTSATKVIAHSFFTEFDIDLFKSGKHFKLYEKMGAHLTNLDGIDGVYFSVWAPNVKKVSVIGNFNHWNDSEHQLNVRWDGSGIWEGFIPGLKEGEIYKYKIFSSTGVTLEKSDPYGFYCEIPPKTASICQNLDYQWEDAKWMKERHKFNDLNSPYSVYEVHLGSWKRNFEEKGRSLTYRELSEELVDYVQDMGFTHVELLPVMHHPFFGSWGYQITNYYAPSSVFGTPQDFMSLVDRFHQAQIGVILDWVPSHFPGDQHGLYQFDGTSLYEHEDPRLGFHPDWNSYIFNYGRNEVRSFLISNAMFWLDLYHADGLRVDAVASMLYLVYSRKEGEWVPNRYGGRENLEAISFMKELNETVYSAIDNIHTIAEESTAWPMVTRPTSLGGLGFGMKWMMGWMNDTLEFFKKDPVHRKYHQNDITFSLTYAFTENFMLPLSHDEVVHGKGAIIDRMPGDDWQRFANLRLLYSYMFTHPGYQLLFMGNEIGQTSEWQHDHSIKWDLLEYKSHRGVHELIRDLNRLIKHYPALYEKAFDATGFEWVDYSDSMNSIIVYLRKGHDQSQPLLVLCNFTPMTYDGYRVGVTDDSSWKEVFNSDDIKYWGSGIKNDKIINPERQISHGKDYSITFKVPPLSVIIFNKSGS